ncbi:expressed unknown protein [Seminavis robusta]|uniref:Uncharacterized protein n=1 Tax=Seminavis robusta TaxID=568900 RepID=A0A9N8ESM3_9STRA|nr:expressed unknown protein [Seminavis robusta]|eukprot:Sro1839_g300890.1 n/a (207) ;mRNA; r:8792-9412
MKGFTSFYIVSLLLSLQGSVALPERKPSLIQQRRINGVFKTGLTPFSSTLDVSRGGAKTPESTSGPTGPFRWFKPTFSPRERSLAAWLLFWNGIALVDALMFTFRAKQNLDGYLVGEWGPHAMAQTRMLANCQLALIATVALVAFTGDEKTLKNCFKIMILATLGAFRAVAAGVRDGAVKAPWKTGYAAVMSAPPLLVLGYFAFVF